MAATMGNPGSQLRTTLSRLTPVQKIALGAAVITLVAGTLVLTRTGGNVTMAAAYTGLEPQDAAAVTDELLTRNIQYELVDGGRTILVPADQVYDIRVDLSGKGLPAVNEGYALLDRQGITTSEFRQRIDYQRALEGELARTLRSIDGVASATVHLALPEESVFVDQPGQPTASVLVTRSGSASLSSAQVAAMVHLVASSVKGMTPENVTIADSSGAVLSTAGQTGRATAANGEAAAAIEHEVGTSLRSMISRVTGAENVAVTVRAELDNTERQATTEFFDSTGEDGVVIAERVATEEYSGIDESGTTGVLGPDGAPVAEGTQAGSESTYSKEDAERTFAVNRTVESTTFASGTVTRLHVAVLVDEDAVTEAQLASIEAMVSTAAGVDLERGDQVVVTRLPFDTSAAAAAEEAAAAEAAAAAAEQQASMIRTGVISFIVLIALLLAYRSTRRARREVSTPIDIGAIRAEPLDELEEAAAELLATPQVERVDPIVAASRDALDELSALADRKPEDVAQILQNWLSDEVGSR